MLEMSYDLSSIAMTDALEVVFGKENVLSQPQLSSQNFILWWFLPARIARGKDSFEMILTWSHI